MVFKKLLAALSVVCLLTTPTLAYEPTEPTVCEEQMGALIPQGRLVLEKSGIAKYSSAHEQVQGVLPPVEFTSAELVMFMEVERGFLVVTLTKDCQWLNGLISKRGHQAVLAYIENSEV